MSEENSGQTDEGDPGEVVAIEAPIRRQRRTRVFVDSEKSDEEILEMIASLGSSSTIEAMEGPEEAAPNISQR